MHRLLLLLLLPSAAFGQATRYPTALVHRPTPVPDRVVLTWKSDPTTTQAVTWRTDTSVTKPLAQIALSEDGPEFAPLGSSGHPERTKLVPGTTQLLHADLGDAHYHRVHFEGLTPKTKYLYRVGDGANWSEWFPFATAGREPEPFGFVYFGDAQNELKQHWSRVARGAYSAMPAAKFFLHAGDLIDNGNSDASWGDWHTAAGWINGMVPSVPVTGNHEYVGRPKDYVGSGLTDHWNAQFTLPDHGPTGLAGTAYHFDYQGVRFIVLNTNEKLGAQAAWVTGVLANNPNRWTVVCLHHPIYSTAKGRDNKIVRDTFRPIFDRFRVDLVLQGHDHTYGRSGLMRDDNLLSGAQAQAESGTVYVVSVSGPKMYSLGEQDWMMSSAQQKQLYQLVRIDGDRLHYESRTAADVLYDEFELRKSPTGNRLVEQSPLAGERAALPRPTREELYAAIGGMTFLAIVPLGLRLLRRRSV